MIRFLALLLIPLAYGCSTCDIFGTCRKCPEGQKRQDRGEYDVCVADGPGDSEEQPIIVSADEVTCYVYDSNGLVDAVSGYCEDQPIILSFDFSADIPGEDEKFQGRYISVNTDSGIYSSSIGRSCYFESQDCSGACLVGLNNNLDQFSGNGNTANVRNGAYFDGQKFHVLFQNSEPVVWDFDLDRIQSYYANGICSSADSVPEQLFVPDGTAEIKHWPLKPPFRFDYGEQ